jgi:hypothetical protein
MRAQPPVRQKAVRLGGLIVKIAKVRIFDFGVLVLAGDSIDFGAVAPPQTVELETARCSVHLREKRTLNFLSKFFDGLCFQIKALTLNITPAVLYTGTVAVYNKKKIFIYFPNKLSRDRYRRNIQQKENFYLFSE